MHEVIDQLEEPTAAEELVLSRKDKAKPYMDAFVKWCDKHSISPTVPRLIEWDELYNHSKIQSLFGTTDEQLDIARKTLYNRLFYTYFSQKIVVNQKPLSVGSKTFEPETKVASLTISMAQKGIYIPTMGADAKDHLIERTKIELRNLVNKFTVLQIPLEKLQTMLSDVIAEG